MTADEEATKIQCPECDGEGLVSLDADDGATHAAFRCQLCGGDGWIGHAMLLSWQAAQRRRPRGGAG